MTENEVPEITEEIQDYITNVVAAYARRNAIIDPRDIHQHLYLMWYEQAKNVAKYLADEDSERGNAKLLRAMSNWAANYCIAETAAICGYKAEDVCFYSKKQLRALLPMLGDTNAWTSLAVRPSDGGRQCAAPLAERGEELAVLADLRAGFEKLNDRDRDLLSLRFIETGIGDSQTDEEEAAIWLAHETICDRYGLVPGSARMGISRAVTKLQKNLGGPRVLHVHRPERRYE